MAVCPGNVFPRRSAGGIEEARLGQQDERPLGMAAMAHRIFGSGDFLEAAAEMHGGRPRAVRRFPGNGAVQRVIDLEDAGTIAVLGEATGESGGETVACDAQQLMRRDVTEDGVVLLEGGQILYVRRSLDCAAERREMPAESAGYRLRAAARNRPAYRMRGCAENDAKGSAQRLIETQEGMRGQAGEEGLRAFAAEEMSEHFCRWERSQAEAR